ncbi:UNVERIFIED_CONTAM: hypothetical protein FKN15_006326 [Acipenser sinensis]
MVASGVTHSGNAANITSQFRVEKGCSERCVRRLCAKYGFLKKGCVSDSQLEIAVVKAIGENHMVERMWPEVNNRVNYPIKGALIQLVDQEQVDMEDNIVRHCISNLTCHICHLGINRVVQAWNAHRIPGKGIPNALVQSWCVWKIVQDLLPLAPAAADLYQHEVGSSLTRVSIFATDPFPSEEEKLNAERQFADQYPDTSLLLESAISHNYGPFQDALKYLINVTQRNVQ